MNKSSKLRLSQLKKQYFAISRHASARGGFLFRSALRLFELARVLVRLDHVASIIVNANHSIDVSGCNASRIRLRC